MLLQKFENQKLIDFHQDEDYQHRISQNLIEQLISLKDQINYLKKQKQNSRNKPLILFLIVTVLLILINIVFIEYFISNRLSYLTQKIGIQDSNLQVSEEYNFKNKKQEQKKEIIDSIQQQIEVCKKNNEQYSIQYKNKQHEKTMRVMKILCKMIQKQSSIENKINKLQEVGSMIKQLDQTIEVLHKDYKRKVYKQRKQLLNNPQSTWKLTKNQIKYYLDLESLNYQNLATNQLQKREIYKQRQNIMNTQYEYYQKKYRISQINSENNFCIIVPTWNNIFDQRYQLNLASIINQNYTNFHLHIVDDLSSDQTYYLIKRYLRRNNISISKATLQINDEKGYGLKNIIYTAKKYCNQNDIVTVVDGDDSLLGLNTLKLFNYFYSKNKLGVAWSNLISYNFTKKNLARGISKAYNKQQIQDQSYRTRQGWGVHLQLRTFKAKLLFNIREEDLKQNGKYFKFDYDQVIMFPIEEMSCKKLAFLDENVYFYNQGTQNNDYELNRQEQLRIEKIIKSKPKYPCHNDFI